MSPPPGRGRAGGATVFPPSPSSALNKPDSFDYLTAEASPVEHSAGFVAVDRTKMVYHPWACVS